VHLWPRDWHPTIGGSAETHMDTLLDYLAWIAIALTAAIFLSLFVAACLLLAHGFRRLTRCISVSREAMFRILYDVWQEAEKLRQETVLLMKRQHNHAAYAHVHRASPRRRA
jgi:hypothetical protein